MTTTRFVCAVSGAAALALAACGGGGGGGGGGTGGGAGGAGGLCSDAPACVAALYNLGQSCPATGACTTQTGPATNGVIATCFANGVKVYTDFEHGMIRQTKPDGTTTCVVETYGASASDPGTLDLTFMDANGTVIATATSNSAGQVFTCDGRTYNPAVQCPSAGGSEPTCAPGSCQ